MTHSNTSGDSELFGVATAQLDYGAVVAIPIEPTARSCSRWNHFCVERGVRRHQPYERAKVPIGFSHHGRNRETLRLEILWRRAYSFSGNFYSHGGVIDSEIVENQRPMV